MQSVGSGGSPLPALTPQASSSGPNIAAIFAALLRRWRMATFARLLAGISAAVLTYSFAPPARYKAHAMLHVATVQPRIIIDTNEIRTDFKTYQKTQETLLKNRLVLEA